MNVALRAAQSLRGRLSTGSDKKGPPRVRGPSLRIPRSPFSCQKSRSLASRPWLALARLPPPPIAVAPADLRNGMIVTIGRRVAAGSYNFGESTNSDAPFYKTPAAKPARDLKRNGVFHHDSRPIGIMACRLESRARFWELLRRRTVSAARHRGCLTYKETSTLILPSDPKA